MKKVFLAGLFGTVACCAAMASDGGVYTETYTNHVNYNFDSETYYVDTPALPPVQSRVIVGRRPAPAPMMDTARPCAHPAGDPMRVKTHTEVIDHYQVYQPVTVYEPVGTYTERRMVEVPHCNRCNG